MTVTSTQKSVSYTLDGATTAFTVPFRWLDDSWIEVQVNGAVISAYTLAGVGESTGTMTLSSPGTSGHALVISRVVPEFQLSAFRNRGTFLADQIEDAVDTLTMMVQQKSTDPYVEDNIEQADAFRSCNEFTLDDDKACYIALNEIVRGVFLLSGDTSAAGAAEVHFRAGDADAHVTKGWSTGPTVTVGTGTLAGTTGTDTHLTIRADTATNRLYIENRTGAQRSYVYMFMATNGTSDVLDFADIVVV